MTALQRLTQLAEWATYPFLLLSGILILAIPMVTPFVVPLTIRNDTRQPIQVTPIGTVGKKGLKSGLPIVVSPWLPLPAARNGGFPVLPGESVTVEYDMDDINFSEIVIESPVGIWRQLVTDPNPTEDQYHPPSESEYAISDIATLEPVAPDVLAAADDAIRSTHGHWKFLSFVASPWVVYWMLRSLRSRLDRSVAANSPATVSPA